MDRSFLTVDNVVKASRQFVCIRLATYEDQAEARFMKDLVRTRSGELENTVFGILSPDGRSSLARSGRGPHAFRTAAGLSSEMLRIAARYKQKSKPLWTNTQMPYVKSVELALNVAACDRLPAVIIVAPTQADREQIENQLLPAVWSEPYAGRFVYALASKQSQLKPITKSVFTPSILIVQPGVFGLTAEILQRVSSDQLRTDSATQTTSQKLTKICQNFEPQVMDYRTHINLGINLDIDWKTEIPVTDRQSIQAKQRSRGQ